MTLHQEASAAPVPDQRPNDPRDRTPDGLICPASTIFDQAALDAAIEAARQNGDAPRDIRNMVVKHLNEARKHGNDVIAAAF
ncbi:MAG: hypothetical protein MRY67_09015, partial [Rhodovulum sp.]|nr:hypothetical protein [Rhodovulum sp.]